MKQIQWIYFRNCPKIKTNCHCFSQCNIIANYFWDILDTMWFVIVPKKMKPWLSVMATISSIFSRQYASKFLWKVCVQDSKSLLAASFFHHSYQSVLYVLSYKKKLWQSLLTLFFVVVHETIYEVVMVKRMNIHAAGSIIVNNTLLISQLQGNKRKKNGKKLIHPISSS